MRTRALVAVSLLAVAAVASQLSAQRLPTPRIGRGTVPTTDELPPTSPEIGRNLAYKRANWTAEGYALFATTAVPDGAGGASTFTTFGTGTHAAYRLTRMIDGTVDLTASTSGSPVLVGTAEVGARLAPLPYDEQVQPFFDLRGSYGYMQNNFFAPGPGGSGSPMQQIRYNRGLGGVAGAGFAFSVTPSLGVTTELSAMRSHMTTFRVSEPGTVPAGSTYWMNTYRFAIGLTYTRMTPLHMNQNPRG